MQQYPCQLLNIESSEKPENHKPIKVKLDFCFLQLSKVRLKATETKHSNCWIATTNIGRILKSFSLPQK